MKQLLTSAMVLTRTNYGEADRIVTLLTPDYGKLRMVAKGVRRIKSKLAGGIELFSVSQITFVRGRAELGTLISARLEHHYGMISRDITRTMLGYDLIKQLHRATEDEPEADYFELLHHAFQALDDPAISLDLIQLWFTMQLLRLAGHTPNLRTDTEDQKLTVEKRYRFSIEDMTFATDAAGPFTAKHIKFLRLGFYGYEAKVLHKIQDSARLVTDVKALVHEMSRLST